MPEQAANTRVLVVEDDPNIVDLIRSNLAVRGFDTVVSTDGLRALNHALLAAEPSTEEAAEREASVFQPRNFWS